MAQIYRDYGAISGASFPNNMVEVSPRRQVYQVTHEGENFLPFMNRSFISFSYGGKNIEEFNLVATISNNSLDRPGYANFEDIVTSYSNLNGQQYWNTHYQTNELEFILATDGIDQRELDDFLHWFRAGETKELILAEHPNRAILARVKDVPQLNLLPYEEKIKVKIGNNEYPTSTTLYKGEIVLHLVMDQPHWYSILNILGKKEGDHYIDKWTDANKQEIDVFASQDDLKILYEDGIPLGSMIQSNMLLGNGAYANVENNIAQRIWDPQYRDINGQSIPNLDNLVGGGACIDGIVNGVTYVGIVAGAIINADGNGITELLSGDNAYFYYAGTAPAPTIISFTLTPSISDGYIIIPANTYAPLNGKPYNIITIESVNKQEFQFTTPNVFTSFNKANYIFSTYVQSGASRTWESIREIIREEVRHPAVRAWANKVINDLHLQSDTAVDSLYLDSIINNMQQFLKDSNGHITPATFIFNSETGEAKGIFKYRLVSSPSNVTEIEENVGDMLRSNYIIIKDRNYPTDAGEFVAWTNSHKEYSHRIYHNVDSPLRSLSIIYKNMYL